MESEWQMDSLLANKFHISLNHVQKTITLFEEGATIPFIARYRREHTGNLEATNLRKFQQAYNDLKQVKQKIQNAIATIEKQGNMTPTLKSSLLAAQTLSDIDHLYSPYKPGNKRSLAERARQLGLEPIALRVLKSRVNIDWNVALRDTDGSMTLIDLQSGVQNIIADIVAKDKDTLDLTRKICEEGLVLITSLVSKSAAQAAQSKEKHGTILKKTNLDVSNFEHYFDFKVDAAHIKSHQVMALNRGEKAKCLNVKLIVPSHVKTRIMNKLEQKWLLPDLPRESKIFIQTSISDGYARLIEPHLLRHQWSELSKEAEKASVEIFATNVRNLLLTPPVRGKIVLGLDPGFSHGCKFAIVSPQGDVVTTGVSYLHNSKVEEMEMNKLLQKMISHGCETIALGNGVACRETEAILSKYISRGFFRPLLVVYSIVSEAGASIYSVSEQATQDLPDLDVTVKGAVSIARRLQDPLGELVKIDPKHLGVGSYQHDVSENDLKTALEEVVQECVSFVGVDLNTCSDVLLRHISGLNVNVARNIIQYRITNGPFINREQLKLVKGIGVKTFEQCAGFLKILPETRAASCTSTQEEYQTESKSETVPVKGTKRKIVSSQQGKKKLKKSIDYQPEELDGTIVHPESYHIAKQLISALGSGASHLGTEQFKQQLLQYIDERQGVAALAAELRIGEVTLQIIIDGLSQLHNADIRDKYEIPLFRQGILSLNEVKIGMNLTGQVRNITQFGAFVDVGIGIDALLHISKMKDIYRQIGRDLALGDKVKVTVCNTDIARKRAMSSI